MSKIAYITIDDAPSKDMRLKVDYLVEKGIPAIFYCRGDFMEKNINHVIYAIEKDFIIGNHSYSHPYFSELSYAECVEEIAKTEKLIDEAYSKAKLPRKYKIFRFPFGDKGGGKDLLKIYTEKEKIHIDKIQTYLKNEGFQRACFEKITYSNYLQANLENYVDSSWTFDVKDYVLLSKELQKKHSLLKVEDFLRKLDIHDPKNGLGINDQSSNDIVILHDFEECTLVFEPIIEKLISKKLRFELPSFV